MSGLVVLFPIFSILLLADPNSMWYLSVTSFVILILMLEIVSWYYKINKINVTFIPCTSIKLCSLIFNMFDIIKKNSYFIYCVILSAPFEWHIYNYIIQH